MFFWFRRAAMVFGFLVFARCAAAVDSGEASGLQQQESEWAKEGEAACRIPVVGPNKITGTFRTANGGNFPCHPGVDFAAAIGTPVLAYCPGTVVDFSPPGAAPGQLVAFEGSAVNVRCNGSNYLARLAHLQKVFVRAGQKVSADAQVGTLGAPPTAAGGAPRLHFSMYEVDSAGVAKAIVDVNRAPAVSGLQKSAATAGSTCSYLGRTLPVVAPPRAHILCGG